MFRKPWTLLPARPGWLIAAVLLSACSEPPAPVEPEVVRPVKVVKLATPDSGAIRQYPGQVRAAQRVDLAFEVPGKLRELPVSEGQMLKRGDPVAALDDHDYAATLKSARAEYDNALANYQRGTSLVGDGNISQTDFDRLKAQRDVAAAALAKAEKAVADTRLAAPFDGRVASRFVDNFQEVQAKQPIISLQDIQQLEILIVIPENQAIRRYREGETLPKLTALFDGVPGERFALALKEFSTEADPATQTFRVVLTMPQPAGAAVLPGMSATVEVEDLQPDAADPGVGFILPAAAVFADEAGAAQVWVVDPDTNRVHRRAVGTGELAGGDGIRIRSGLVAGEVVAVSAASRLREGMEIQPVDRVRF